MLDRKDVPIEVDMTGVLRLTESGSSAGRRSMGGVFINYRGDDNPVAAAAIHDSLAGRFGNDNVFRDCVSMQAGEDYPEELRAALERVDALVCVMGPQWLTLKDELTGELRIMQERDWVRREIHRALQRGIAIVPVLLKDLPDNAVPPTEDHLPDSIAALATKQAIDLSQRRFGADMERLVSRLVQLVPALVIPQLFAAPPMPWRPDNAPSTLLRAEHGVVPFIGRDRELADLSAWAAGPAASSATLVVGSAGSGKTRLASELCQRLRKQGWLAGIVSGEAPAVQMRHTATIDKPLLAVVDDVELRSDQLVALAVAIGDRSVVLDAPARLLLLGRSAGNWLNTLQRNAHPRVAELFRTITEQSVIRLDTDIDDYDERFRAALAAFAARLGLSISGSYSAGVSAGGSQAPVVKSWRRASSLSSPHLVAVSR